ncbi:MAG: hypothetical protein ABH829_00215 [archaeon]
MEFVEFLILIPQGLWKVFVYGPYDNPEMLWILIPVYLNWIVNDYYQERRGTDLGNAAANGLTALWVGIDWIRTMFSRLNIARITPLVAFKVGVAVAMLIYGLIIMRMAIQGREVAKAIGRIREVSYFLIVFTPFIYSPYLIRPVDTIPTLVGILLFFVIFYFGVEFIVTKVLPAPKTEEPLPGAVEKDDFGSFGGMDEEEPEKAKPAPTEKKPPAKNTQNTFGASE